MDHLPFLIGKPERKKDYYICKIQSHAKKPVQLTIPGVQWMKMTRMKDGNMVLRIYIPPDAEAHTILQRYDDEVFRITKDMNRIWFRNALTEEQLHTFFHSSMDRLHPSMSILCRSWMEPLVYKNDTLVSFETLPDMIVPKDASVRVSLEPQGLVFQKTRFGIRWVLKACWITPSMIADDETVMIDRHIVEEDWEYELSRVDKELDAQIQDLQNKIAHIQKYASMLHHQFDSAKNSKDGSVWNDHLERLSKMIAKGHSDLSAFEEKS